MNEYVAWVPAPALRPWVRSMHGYRITGAEPGVHVGMPSSSLTLVVPLDEPLVVAQGGAAPAAYESVVAGLHTTAAHIHHNGDQFGIQLDLDTGAARALFGVPASEIAEASVPLHELVGVAAGELDRIRDLPTWPGRLRALEDLLLRRITDNVPARSPATAAWSRIQRATSAIQVAALAGDLGYSARRLQQLFRAEYGVSPRDAVSIRRFESAHRLVGAGRPLAEVAAMCRYADQAHLTRDWRRITGAPPTVWLRDDSLRYRGAAT